MEIKGRELVLLSLVTLLLGGWQFWIVKPLERRPNAVYLPTRPAGVEIFAPGANSEYGFKLKPLGRSPGPLQLTLDERSRFVFVLKAPGYHQREVLLTREQLARGETIELKPSSAIGPVRAFFWRFFPSLFWILTLVGYAMIVLRPRRNRESHQSQLAGSGRWVPGLEVNGYRLLEEVGRGGMARVFRAVRLRGGENLAFKGLRPEQTQHRQAFEREVQLWKGLSHPNIVHLLDWGEFQGALYLVCDFVEGQTLETPPSRDSEEICGWMLQLLAALDYAHGQGIVHQDLKPANLLLGADGNLFLTDFGVASSLAGQAGAGGTVGFAPPEQLEGTVSPAHDYYAFGVTLYILLSGRKPFTGDAVECISRQKEGRYEPLGFSELGSLVDRLLEPEPQRRLSDPDEIAHLLRAFKADSNSSTEE